MESEATIVFLRAPEKGKVKTRLEGFLDQPFILQLYKGFAEDLLETIENAGDKYIYFCPSEKRNIIENWLENEYNFCSQKGNNIGQRMSGALEDIFRKGYSQAILIGTDIPELSCDIIKSAHTALGKKDVVIGPSYDGGYYLIGFEISGFSTSIFDDIDWSTKTVFDQTIQAFKQQSLQYKVLPQLNDIDTHEDLNGLADRIKKGGKAGKRTLENLKAYEN